MRIVKQITEHPFLNLKEVSDTELKCKGYCFAERNGVDSVAFICFSEQEQRFMVNNEATPPIGGFLKRAFGGSIDKETSYEDIVKDEVEEEAGYNVSNSDIHFVGKVFVSTQMNQYCHLYLVLIEEKKKASRKPENPTEAVSTPVWVSEQDIIKGEDWKSISIIQKAREKKLI